MTFTEVLVALGMACATTLTALSLLAAADYHASRERTELSAAARIRQLHASMAGMPYTSLANEFPPSATSTVYRSDGFLLEQSVPLFAWRYEAILERSDLAATPGEIRIRAAFFWQEPAFPVFRGASVERMLELPPLRRTRT